MSAEAWVGVAAILATIMTSSIGGVLWLIWTLLRVKLDAIRDEMHALRSDVKEDRVAQWREIERLREQVNRLQNGRQA